MFEICADGLSVRDAKQARLRVLGFRDGKRLRFLLKIGDGERRKWCWHGFNITFQFRDVELALVTLQTARSGTGFRFSLSVPS